jgi:hypothetical protein
MEKTLIVLAAVAFACAVISAVWWLFYWLWNEIAVGVFGAPELTFWQAVGLLTLVSLLTNGLRAVTRKE